MTRIRASRGRSISPVRPLPRACPSGVAAGVCSLPWWRSGDRSGATRGAASCRSREQLTITEAGRVHPLLASRPVIFDALCSHLDEIETLPPDSQVLAANEVSAIQAMVVQTPRRGSFHGTQYHPEHTLAVSAALMQMRAAELVAEGFATEPTKIVAIAEDYRAMDAEPTRRDLIWRYGIASEIMDPVRRTTEIGNWLRAVVVPRRF